MPFYEAALWQPSNHSGFPNIGLPSYQRLTGRWTRPRSIAGAEVPGAGVGDVVVGADAVHHRLSTTADALRWLEPGNGSPRGT
ncbi:MAG: hypothetical protein R2706_06320 [Acidimicrobiales bacterium]